MTMLKKVILLSLIAYTPTQTFCAREKPISLRGRISSSAKGVSISAVAVLGALVSLLYAQEKLEPIWNNPKAIFEHFIRHTSHMALISTSLYGSCKLAAVACTHLKKAITGVKINGDEDDKLDSETSE